MVDAAITIYGSEPNGAEPNTIIFAAEGTEMLRLTTEGFIYKGEVVEDAGEAYRLFIEWMHKINHPLHEVPT